MAELSASVVCVATGSARFYKPFSDLREEFEPGSTFILDPFDGASASFVDGRLRLNVDAPDCWASAYSPSGWDIKGSSVFLRMAKNTSEPRVEIQLGADSTGSVKFSISSDGDIQARAYSGSAYGGTTYSSSTVTYDPAVHAWFRFREVSGTVYFDTAPATATSPPSSGDWVNFWSLANQGIIDRIHSGGAYSGQLYFYADNYTAGAATGGTIAYADFWDINAPALACQAVCQSSFGLWSNEALSSNGTTATVASSYSGTSPTTTNDGNRAGPSFWADSSVYSFPEYLTLEFSGAKTISRADVIGLQDDYSGSTQPTLSMTSTLYGLLDFSLEYWTGSAWLTIPGTTVTGNTFVWRQFFFSPITTDKIRLACTATQGSNEYLRMVEFEAWSRGSNLTTGIQLAGSAQAASTATADLTVIPFVWEAAAQVKSYTGLPGVNVALATNGATATASSEYDSNYPATTANNGDRAGNNWGTPAGGWNDGTGYSFPDWLQIDFAGSKTINEIDVFTLQDSFSSPVEPYEGQTFTTYGITNFEVQYWTGSAWAAVPSGVVTGNNLVWRRFPFSPITTDKIRVYVTAAVGHYSRITELEAWSHGVLLSTGIRLAASVAGVASVVGADLTVGTGGFAAASQCATVATADLTTDIRPAASVACASSVTGALTTQVRLAATVAALSTATADLTTGAGITLEATTTDVVSTTGALTTGIALASSATAQTNNVLASLNTGIPLTASLACVSAVTGALTTAVRLAAVPATVSTVTGALTLPKPLAGSLQTVSSFSAPFNAARAAGAAYTASSVYGASFGVAGVFNGDRRGNNWGTNGGWNDANNGFPDWIEVDFGVTRDISEVNVFGVQDSYGSPVEPYPGQTSNIYNLRDFEVQYWTGSAWATVPDGARTNNSLVWNQFLFSPVTTTKIRVYVTAASSIYSRVTELEAWSSGTLLSTGIQLAGPAQAIASTTAALGTQVRLNGSLTGACIATADLSAQGQIQLVAAIASQSSAIDATLGTQVRLNGSLTGACSVINAQLTGVAAVFASSVAVVSTASAGLSIPKPVAASVASLVSTTGQITTGIRLVASGSSVSNQVLASLNTGIPLTASLAAVSTTTAALTTQVRLAALASSASVATLAASDSELGAASAVCVSSVAGAALTVPKPIAAIALVRTSTTGDLSTQILLNGSVALESIANASLLADANLGAAFGTGDCSGTASLSTQLRMAAVTSAQVAVSAELDTSISLVGSIAAVCSARVRRDTIFLTATRTFDILAETRELVIAADARTFSIPADARTFAIPAEIREIMIPAENRTLSIVPK